MMTRLGRKLRRMSMSDDMIHAIGVAVVLFAMLYFISL